MAEDKIRLGGMALRNGVLVHGPTSWACAVRLPDGTLKVAAQRKRVRASKIKNPLLRGPARLAEAVAVLPSVKRTLPEAQLPFENSRVLGAMAASAVGVRVIRTSRLSRAAQELAAGVLALTPAILSLRGNELAAYHGAEHISIGSYEHDEPRSREHERCGSHLIGPLLATTAAANVVAAAVPARFRRPARAVASLGAIAAATELFGWMVRNPEKKAARALARPGHELQHRYATKEPSPEQVEVAEAALHACLELESSPRAAA
jgi:uncharacterized protein YqhQ